MRFIPALVLLALNSSQVALQAQTPASQTAPAPSTSSTQTSATASSILNPAISTLQAALDGIRVEKWKASTSVREDTEANISSVRRDLESTLPPLLVTADGAPDSVAEVLPAFRNIEALYDVLLRIAAVARLAAPAQQSAALEQAMSSLESARRTLGDQLQGAALNQDRKVYALQASLRAVPPPAPAPAPCVPPPTPAKKRKAHAKPHPKPAPPAAAPQSSTPPSQ